MQPALFKKWKISPALFPPSVGRKSWIPAKNRKILLENYASEKIPVLKTDFEHQNDILFLHGETFNKWSE